MKSLLTMSSVLGSDETRAPPGNDDSALSGRWTSRDVLVATHQQITRVWWESRRAEFDLYVSELVLQRIRGGDARLSQ